MDAEKEGDNFIVGIGASAGGLEAIRSLLASAPHDAPAAYVVAQHMAPTQRSMLATLIARETHLTVIELSEPTRPLPNTVYVTPPNADVILENGELHLQPASTAVAAPKPSVDRLFDSIAKGAGRRAIGIILSGTGSDGSIGVKSIKEAGGITFAQDDTTAKYDGMPNSALETGCIDVVLTPVEIAHRLEQLSLHSADLEAIMKTEADQTPLAEVLQIVLAKTRVDFRDYKSTTILRRLERRMKAVGVVTQLEYAQFLRKNDAEVEALFRDFLISVTRFFRDPEEFEALNSEIREMVKENSDRPLRVWVAGCATGEEAYSIAILIIEAMGGVNEANQRGLQLFATDIDTAALKVARTGHYPTGSLNDIPEEYHDTYFDIRADGIAVKSALKSFILFSVHNTVQDPPFRKIDLVCCRNLLIYFGPVLQDRAFENFHFSLRQSGKLFLGTADSAASSHDLFMELDSGRKILRKRSDYSPKARLANKQRQAYVAPRSVAVETSRDVGVTPHEATPVNPLVRAIVGSMGGNGLLLTSELSIVAVFGDMSPYVSLTGDRNIGFSHVLLQESLAAELRVLSAMLSEDVPSKKGFRRKLDTLPGKTIQLELLRLSQNDLREVLFLLIVRSEEDPPEVAAPEAPDVDETVENDPATNATIDALRNDLLVAQDALNQTIEQWEETSEELKTANEELQANNEELQSINEELETSNEELQSTNEELVTINEGFQTATDELHEINDELQTILQQIESPMLIVNNQLIVTRYSSAAKEMFDPLPAGGKPHLSQLGVPDGFPSIARLADRVIRLGEPIEETVVLSSRIVKLSVSAFANSRGEPMGAIIVLASFDGPVSADMASFSFGVVRRVDGAIVRAHRTSLLFRNIAPGRLVGMNMKDFADEASAKAMMEEDRRFLESGAAEKKSVSRVRTQSGERTLLSRRFRVESPDEDEAVVHVENVDVTDFLDEGGGITPDFHLVAK